MSSQTAASAICGVILLCEIGVVLFAVLASRAPLRVAGRLLKAVGLLRPARQPEPPADPDVALNLSPDLKAKLGRSAYAPLLRALRPDTATERALKGIDPGIARDDGKTEGPYDFSQNEERHLQRHGLLFRWIAVKPSYMPDISLISDEIVEVYLKAAKRFFRGQVNISADVTSLYEDVDAANTITMFRSRDRNCYYLLHQMRRIIDDNVRKLAFLYSSILLAVLVVELFFLDRINPNVIAGTTEGGTVFGIKVELLDRGLGGLVLCLIGAFFMWLTYFMEYAPYQRNNGRELRSFLSRYLSRLSDRYRDSMANARAVTVGDETDGNKLRTKAQLWHKIMLWLAFRSFFIETFVRNILFQIGRNCGYYVVLVPLCLFLLVGVTMWAVLDIKGVSLLAVLGLARPIFAVGYLLLCVLAGLFLHNSMNSIDEMNQADWLGFDNLNVDRGMDDVVGKYAEDVAFWKGRLDR